MDGSEITFFLHCEDVVLLHEVSEGAELNKNPESVEGNQRVKGDGEEALNVLRKCF